MDPFMLFFAIGWGLACFIAGAFAGWMYARAAGNQVSEIDFEAITEAKWKEAETLLEHLLEVSQSTASELTNHHEQVESAMDRISEAVVERPSEPTQSMTDAVLEANHRLEARFEEVMHMIEENARVEGAPAATFGHSDPQATPAEAAGQKTADDHVSAGSQAEVTESDQRTSDAQVRERLEGANSDTKSLARRQPRVPFEEMHDVAPASDGRLPNPQDYMRVCCRDISSAGFSFYFSSEVRWEGIVLRTQHKGKVREITADVVHCSRTTKPSAPGPFIVGCRFTGPLKRPAANGGTKQEAEKPAGSEASLTV